MGGSGTDPDAGRALFGSGAYDTETSAAVEAAARAWLEERRYVSAGLEDVHAQAVIYVEDALDPEEAIEFRALAKELGESGEVDPAAAASAVDAMVEASERGMHCGYALMFVATGHVPGPG